MLHLREVGCTQDFEKHRGKRCNKPETTGTPIANLKKKHPGWEGGKFFCFREITKRAKFAKERKELNFQVRFGLLAFG